MQIVPLQTALKGGPTVDRQPVRLLAVVKQTVSVSNACRPLLTCPLWGPSSSRMVI
jgi:molybdenum-dependent DNA-binding transcriptional regulator ModE